MNNNTRFGFLEHFDFILFLSVLSLITIGILFIYSSSVVTSGVSVSNEYIKQIVWASTGLVIMVFVALYDYRMTTRYVHFLFIFLVVILLYTRLFGKYVNGAKSWLGFGGFGLQPSEMCKVIYILFLAHYFDTSIEEHPKQRFLKAFFIMCVPVGLILLQPDLGTASVFIPIFLVMAFVAGIPIKFILFIFATGMLSVTLAVLPVWQSEIVHKSYALISVLTELKFRLLVIVGLTLIAIISLVGKIFYPSNKYYYWIAYFACIFDAAMICSYGAGKVLKPYQVKRLIIFLDPSSDPLGAGWNINQSMIAIGSGGFFGRGFLNGTQSHYRFLPQQSTDFIFSILSEETGFVGGIFIFLMYFLILLRALLIMKSTRNNYGYFIASGILAMFFFHFIVNVGMVMGIMPITGIPLFFLSYGGSSLWTAMVCIGLLMSINYRKQEFV
ncbi:MAG: rod shape-determining protein RodA [Treponema sp.]|nr:rod shape-determining protein RodA [Treponema sp.]